MTGTTNPSVRVPQDHRKQDSELRVRNALESRKGMDLAREPGAAPSCSQKSVAENVRRQTPKTTVEGPGVGMNATDPNPASVSHER